MESKLIKMYSLDIESELAKVLQEEIAKEIEENGTQTWAEACGHEPNNSTLTLADVEEAIRLVKNES